MSEPTVTKNDGEVATFSDNNVTVRQSPSLNKTCVSYKRVVPPDVFEAVFVVGSNKTQIADRLRDPLPSIGTPASEWRAHQGRALASVAVRVHEATIGRGLTHESFIKLVHFINEKLCNPPLGPDDVQQVLDSIFGG